MTDEVRLVDYHYIRIDEEVGAAADIVEALHDSGVNLLAFSGFPDGTGGSQLDFIPESADALVQVMDGMKLALSKRKSGFLVRGEDRPGAIAGILNKLARAGVHVTAMQAVSAGAGRYGALLWVEPRDVRRAQRALDAIEGAEDRDLVDVTSEASFPASDAPSWAGH